MNFADALALSREDVAARICPIGYNLVLTVHPWRLRNNQWINGLDFGAYPAAKGYRVSAGSILIGAEDKDHARQLLIDAWFSYWAAFQHRVGQATPHSPEPA